MTACVYQNARAQPATGEDVARYHLGDALNMEAVADPTRQMAEFFPIFARDKYVLIETDTMEIIHVSETMFPDEVSDRINAWIAAQP